MNIKHILLSLFLLFATGSAQAETVRDFFISEPGNVCELLT